MTTDNSRYYGQKNEHQGILIAGFSDWSSDVDIASGVVEYIAQQCGSTLIADIDSHDYYLNCTVSDNELSVASRPSSTITNGLLESYDHPTNMFYYSPKADMILFCGYEPQLNWKKYASDFFEIIDEFRISRIYTISSKSGLIPHSRQPHISAYVSERALLEPLNNLNIRLSDYSGPADINAYLTGQAKVRGILMTNLIVEMPPYIEGRNPKSIDAVLRSLMGLTDLKIDLRQLKRVIDEMDSKLDVAVQDHQQLHAQVKALEEYYDTNVFENEMGEFKRWLLDKGLNLD